jgi:hypothetical protein
MRLDHWNGNFLCELFNGCLGRLIDSGSEDYASNLQEASDEGGKRLLFIFLFLLPGDSKNSDRI